ncbi:family 43 glycosylhydrolase [Plantactinospora soyae]|uniref:GH43 family beta-xylosidase n=1 Tax=Plantactinospora soyae TaxID=1544732 RepID=A0A927MAR6_9ACTN|nr:family 43 glycosylhydrolase [Plantactinospora soyae]MBE1491049.1 GH43 family beta-xylosidase [Plantactinospora soyae]
MRLTQPRSVLATVAVCAVGAVGAITVVSSAAAAAGCAVTYRIGSQWSGGFTGTADLTNLGDPLNGWSLTWSFAAGQQVSQGWNAIVSQSGTQVTARNQTWNAGLGTGAGVSIGFNASWNNSTNPAPVNFALNGVACTGTTTPTTAPPTTGTPTTAPPTTAPPRATFTNPLKVRGPDPWLTYYEGYYYLATTTWNNTVTMRRSRTLGGLSTAPDTLLFTLARPNGAGTMWAPEFHLLDGPSGRRWYFYYTAGREPFNLGSQRIHVLESAGLDPMGPYTFKADMLDPTADNTWELDPGILQLNGNLYLLGTFYNGSQPMFIRPLSNPWTASGTRRILSTPTLSWETVGGAVNEGAEVLHRNGRTFIVYSASHCSTPDYKLGMLTYNGGDPLNSSSWVKSPQPVFQRSNANGVYGPGHNGFFKSPDGTEDWIVYHANSSASGGCDMNRSTRAQKFTWNADGTPNFGTPAPLGAQLAVPSGETTG